MVGLQELRTRRPSRRTRRCPRAVPQGRDCQRCSSVSSPAVVDAAFFHEFSQRFFAQLPMSRRMWADISAFVACEDVTQYPPDSSLTLVTCEVDRRDSGPPAQPLAGNHSFVDRRLGKSGARVVRLERSVEATSTRREACFVFRFAAISLPPPPAVSFQADGDLCPYRRKRNRRRRLNTYGLRGPATGQPSAACLLCRVRSTFLVTRIGAVYATGGRATCLK